MTTPHISESSRLSERFAEQYEKCQTTFKNVLSAARDRTVGPDEFTSLCEMLNQRVLRLREIGDELTELRRAERSPKSD